MSQNKIDDVKAGIRATLNSSPLPLTIMELRRDYMKFTGEDIPLKTLGFRTFHEFLLEIPDVATLDNPDSPFSIVRSVINKKTAHISRLVHDQKQSIRIPRKYTPYGMHNFRSLPPRFNSRPTYIPQDFLKSVVKLLYQHKPGMRMDKFKNEVMHMASNHLLKCPFEQIFQKLQTIPGVKIQGNMISASMINDQNSSITSTNKNNSNAFNACNGTKHSRIIADIDLVTDDDDDDGILYDSDKSVENEVTDQLNEMNLCRSHSSSMENGFDNDYMDGAESVNLIDDAYLDEKANSVTISKNLKKNLQALLDENPNGIWLNQLSSKYQVKYGYTLNSNDHGFDSPADLSLKLPEIFTYKRYTEEGDYLLLDARKFTPDIKEEGIIPQSLISELKKIFRKSRESISTDELALEYQRFYTKTLDSKDYGFSSMDSLLKVLQQTSNAFHFRKVKNRLMLSLNEYVVASESINRDEVLESIQFNYFPEEVCDADFTLELDQLYSQLEKGLRIAARVAEVYSPERFYIHLEENMKLLNTMMDDLHAFYETNGKEYEVLPDVMRRDLLCACRYTKNGKWHRVSVMIPKVTQVKVRYIDYGTVELVPLKNLRYLHKAFAKLPACAIRSKLIGIKPREISMNISGKQSLYPLTVSETFYDIMVEKSLIVEVIRYDVMTSSIEMDVETTGKDGDQFSVREILIEHGYVDRKKIEPEILEIVEEKKPKSKTKKKLPEAQKQNGFPPEFDVTFAGFKRIDDTYVLDTAEPESSFPEFKHTEPQKNSPDIADVLKKSKSDFPAYKPTEYLEPEFTLPCFQSNTVGTSVIENDVQNSAKNRPPPGIPLNYFSAPVNQFIPQAQQYISAPVYQSPYTSSIPNPTQYTSPIPNQAQYTSPIPNQAQYTSPIPNQAQYTSSIPNPNIRQMPSRNRMPMQFHQPMMTSTMHPSVNSVPMPVPYSPFIPQFGYAYHFPNVPNNLRFPQPIRKPPGLFDDYGNPIVNHSVPSQFPVNTNVPNCAMQSQINCPRQSAYSTLNHASYYCSTPYDVCSDVNCSLNVVPQTLETPQKDTSENDESKKEFQVLKKKLLEELAATIKNEIIPEKKPNVVKTDENDEKDEETRLSKIIFSTMENVKEGAAVKENEKSNESGKSKECNLNSPTVSTENKNNNSPETNSSSNERKWSLSRIKKFVLEENSKKL